MARRSVGQGLSDVDIGNRVNNSLDDSDLELSHEEEDYSETSSSVNLRDNPNDAHFSPRQLRKSRLSSNTIGQAVYSQEEHKSDISSDSSDTDCEDDFRSASAISLAASSVARPRRGRTRGQGARLRSCRFRGRSRVQKQHSVEDGWTASFHPRELLVFEPRYKVPNTDGWTYVRYFEQYIDNAILEKMVVASNRTYVLKAGKSLGLTAKELKVFIGVNMIMAAINLPQISMYWSREFGVAVIKENMTRHRFFTIRTSLKVVFDNDVSDTEKQKKIWKVFPLFERVLSGCQSQNKPLNMSIDEMIIPFTGQCGIRQYCPGKPNPVGIKIFVLATPDGIVCDMVVYQLDQTFSPEIRNQFNLGESAIIVLCDTLVPGHSLFFDRYFTTVKLLDALLERGFHGTGTMQKNRIPGNCLLIPEKEFVKKERGFMEVKCRADGHIAITRWLDNKPVVIASTLYTNSEVDSCRRWSKRRKEYEMVQRPECVKHYNANMGGVDMADRMLSVCPSRARTRKWTYRFISHMFDLAVSNSWQQFKQDQRKKGIRKIPQLRSFKMELGKQLILPFSISSDSDEVDPTYEPMLPKHKKRKTSIAPIPSQEVRLHKADHLISYTEQQHRCRYQGCSRLTTAFCIKCNIFLCSTRKRNCHLMFHQSNN